MLEQSKAYPRDKQHEVIRSTCSTNPSKFDTCTGLSKLSKPPPPPFPPGIFSGCSSSLPIFIYTPGRGERERHCSPHGSEMFKLNLKVKAKLRHQTPLWMQLLKLIKCNCLGKSVPNNTTYRTQKVLDLSQPNGKCSSHNTHSACVMNIHNNIIIISQDKN